MILERYIIREILGTLIGILLVLTLIILGQQLMLVLEDALRGTITGHIVFEMLGLRMLASLHLLIPFAFFLSTLLALGRLYKDSEMASMMACGTGYTPVYRATLLLALVAALLVFSLSGILAPWASGRAQQLTYEARQQTDISKFRPGVFENSGGGSNVLYFSDYDKKAQLMHGLFLRMQHKGSAGEDLIIAESGRQTLDRAAAEKVLHLYKGVRYQGKIGSPAYTVISFEHYQLRLPDLELQAVTGDITTRPLAELMGADDAHSLAELHWRISAPLTLFILSIIAIPLSYSRPRQGRYAKLFVAIMIFALYVALLGLGKSWIEKDIMPLALGLWWVHSLMLVLTIAMVMRRNGVGWQKEYKLLMARIGVRHANS